MGLKFLKIKNRFINKSAIIEVSFHKRWFFVTYYVVKISLIWDKDIKIRFRDEEEAKENFVSLLEFINSCK